MVAITRTIAKLTKKIAKRNARFDITDHPIEELRLELKKGICNCEPGVPDPELLKAALAKIIP